MQHYLNEREKEQFLRAMERADKAYDPAVRMETSYRGKNGYHSRLSDCMVHEVRLSFSYAYALLNRDSEGDRERAHDILYRVIALQDANPARKTYGIWQYYLEEDLEEMNPPDWNWADFNGKTLLKILAEHGEKLTADIRPRIVDAICRACDAIIRRNVGPTYTNISIMGAYVTIYAGELLNRLDYFLYGKKRLETLYHYNVDKGNFTEFNSPTYTFVCLEDLSGLIRDVRDADCVRMAEELADLAWATIALHYHVPSGQLAGPHDRAYAMLLGDGTKLAIERALDYKVSLVSATDRSEVPVGIEFCAQEMKCPEKYVPYFTEVSGERVIDQTFASGRMAYTYMDGKFTLGSLHREITWNQHRNVLGYFGTNQAPVAVNLKCLHDGWDYSSGLSATVQDKGRALTAIGFVTNGGDTHCNLDMVKNATITASDLRVRWLFEGAVEGLTLREAGEGQYEVTDGIVTVRVGFPYTVFGTNTVRFETSRTERTLCIDAVLYGGETTQIDFRELEKAMIVTTLEMTADPKDEIPRASVHEDGGAIAADFGSLGVRMKLSPAESAVMRASVKLTRNGQPYEPAF